MEYRGKNITEGFLITAMRKADIDVTEDGYPYLDGYQSEQLVLELASKYGFSEPVFENGKAVFRKENIRKWHAPILKCWFAMWRRVR